METNTYPNIVILLFCFVMRDLLSRFFIVKTIVYMIGFSILWYLFLTKVSDIPSKKDNFVTTWINQVCFINSCFDVEIADEDNERQQWLMYRKQLSSNSGMLFIFEKEDIHSFWMKNTNIPLDMIWIDKSGSIIDIQTAQPCKEDSCPNYVPWWSWLYVLEINAWLSSLLWMQKWSTLQFIKK